MWKGSHDKGSLGTMQSFNCNNQLPNIGDYGIATDSRDSNTYTVAKLKDNKCWMTQNLRIVNKTISASDSDIGSGNFTIPISDMSSFNSNYHQNNNSVYQDNEHGTFYSWYTATAGTGISEEMSAPAKNSICPRGFKLPAPEDFQTLYNNYPTVEEITAQPSPNFIIDAVFSCFTRQVYNIGEESNYWSSSCVGSTSYAQVWYMSITKDSINPKDHYVKQSGWYVRCLAK